MPTEKGLNMLQSSTVQAPAYGTLCSGLAVSALNRVEKTSHSSIVMPVVVVATMPGAHPAKLF